MAMPLADWESFHVITETSGAALTGSMSVVIALAAGLSALARPAAGAEPMSPE